MESFEAFAKSIKYARKRNREGIYHSRISQPFAKYSKACKLAKKEFRKPCEIDEFRNPLRNLHVIFKYFAPTPLDFYLKIFCVISYSLLVIRKRSFKIFKISN